MSKENWTTEHRSGRIKTKRTKQHSVIFCSWIIESVKFYVNSSVIINLLKSSWTCNIQRNICLPWLQLFAIVMKIQLKKRNIEHILSSNDTSCCLLVNPHSVLKICFECMFWKQTENKFNCCSQKRKQSNHPSRLK